MADTDDQNSGLETLEDPGSDKASVSDSSSSAAQSPQQQPKPKPKRTTGIFKKINDLIADLNVYLILFVLALVLIIIVAYLSYSHNKKSTDSTTIKPQSLNQEALQNLNNSDISIGDPKQTLGVKSNTVFAGKVLVRDNLEVAGTIKAGSSLNLPGITVTGSSVFDQLQGNKLAISGDALIQGQVNVQKNLVVSGSASFGGNISAPQITIQSLQISGDLQLNRHIDAGGATPGKSDGSALGSGGTSSVSGTDTAGTVAINTGGSPGAGCFTTVNFAQKFNATPHVVITPVGTAAAALNYYITRSTANFTICSLNAAPANSSFSFDYLAID